MVIWGLFLMLEVLEALEILGEVDGDSEMIKLFELFEMEFDVSISRYLRLRDCCDIFGGFEGG